MVAKKANPFSKPEEVKPTVMALISGPEKVGKTYLALKDTPRPMAVIDTEGAAQFYVGRDGFEPFDLLHTRSYREVVDALDYIEAHPGSYESVVIDSISVLYSVLQDAALAKRTAKVVSDGGDPADVDIEQRDWGRIKRLHKSLMARLMNLGINVIVTAREKDVLEKRGGEMIKVGVKPEADKGIGYDFALLTHLERKGTKRSLTILGGWTSAFAPGTEIADPTWDTVFAPVLASAGVKAKGKAHVQSDEEAAHEDATSFGIRLATALEAQGLVEALMAAGYDPEDVRARKSWPPFIEMGAKKVAELTEWAKSKVADVKEVEETVEPEKAEVAA